MKIRSSVSVALAVVGLGVLAILSACEKGPAEKAGAKIDQGAKKVGDAAKDAGSAVKDAAKGK